MLSARGLSQGAQLLAKPCIPYTGNPIWKSYLEFLCRAAGTASLWELHYQVFRAQGVRLDRNNGSLTEALTA